MIVIAALTISVILSGRTQTEQPSEYQIKAAFLYNFAKFVEWPANAFAATNSPMIFGVLGTNVFGGELERAIQGKLINHHPLEFRYCQSAEEARHCHVLFISASLEPELPKIFTTLRGSSVLTVSESPEFIHDGGMINFIIREDKVRFQISDKTARKAGLVISSKLLSLASPVS